MEEFLSLQKTHNIRVVNKIELGNDIYQIEYEIPKYFSNNVEAAKAGKKAGDFSHYKRAKDPKTVYDPRAWSDDAFIELSQKAAAKDFSTKSQAFLVDPRRNRIYSTNHEGLNFRVYLNQDSLGNVFVDNIHPRAN